MTHQHTNDDSNVTLDRPRKQNLTLRDVEFCRPVILLTQFLLSLGFDFHLVSKGSHTKKRTVLEILIDSPISPIVDVIPKGKPVS